MAQEQNTPQGLDLTQGVALTDFVDGKLLGHVGDEEVLLVHSGDEIFAISAHCTHYHGPLAEGLVTGESVRCPWHNACFDLRLKTKVAGIDPRQHQVVLTGGECLSYDRLLLATGAEPVLLPIPGADQKHV